MAPLIWMPLISLYERYFDHNLNFKDFINIIPSPSDNWEYLGTSLVPRLPFEYAPTYQINNIRCYVNHGLYINDQYISGSCNYSRLIEKAHTFHKLLNEATT